MKPSEQLKAARAKIPTPATWTRGAYARDERGASVLSLDPDAVCWCLAGAVFAVDAGILCDAGCFVYLRRAISLPLSEDVSHWQDEDGRTHADVIAALTRAAELAESEGQ